MADAYLGPKYTSNVGKEVSRTTVVGLKILKTIAESIL